MATLSPPMASCSNKKRAGSASLEDSSSFCLKIVSHKDLQDGKELPEPAVRSLKDFMGDSIFLKVPNCRTSWEVDLKKTVHCRRMWLQKGWEEFVSFYNVDEDFILVFSYEGEHSHFKASIYDCNSLEIDYAICGGGDSGCMSTPNSKSTSFSSAPSTDEHYVPEAKSSIPNKPQFEVTMRASHIKSALHIPTRFAYQYISAAETSCSLTLQTSSGKAWIVKCKVRLYSTTISYATWRVFAQDNHLEIGDECVFELIGEHKFRVHIHRNKARQSDAKLQT